MAQYRNYSDIYTMPPDGTDVNGLNTNYPDAFSSVNAGSGTVRVQTVTGLRCIEVTPALNSTCYFGWTGMTGAANAFTFAEEFRWTGVPSSIQSIYRFLSSAAGTTVVDVAAGNDGLVRIVVNGTTVYTSTTALTTSNWYRVEVQITNATTTTGTVHVAFYSTAISTTPISGLEYTGTALSILTNAIGTVRIGRITAADTMAASQHRNQRADTNSSTALGPLSPISSMTSASAMNANSQVQGAVSMTSVSSLTNAAAPARVQPTNPATLKSYSFFGASRPLAFEDFVGASTTDIGATTLETQQAWSSGTGITLNGDGTAGPTSSAAVFNYTEVSQTDVAVEADLYTNTAPGGYIGVISRFVDSSNFVYADINNSDGTVRLVQIVSGSTTVLVSTAAGVVASGLHTLRLETIGGQARVLVDGTEVIPFTGIAPTGTKTGIRTVGNTNKAQSKWSFFRTYRVRQATLNVPSAVAMTSPSSMSAIGTAMVASDIRSVSSLYTGFVNRARNGGFEIGTSPFVGSAPGNTEGFTAKWFGSGAGAGTHTVSSAGARTGAQGLRKAWTVAPTTFGDSGVSYMLKCQPGDVISYSMWLRCSIAQKLEVWFQYFDAAGTLLGTSSINTVLNNMTPGAWHYAKREAIVAPSNTYFINCCFGPSTGGTNWTAGDTLDFDDFTYTFGPTIPLAFSSLVGNPFLESNTNEWNSWQGASGAVTSSRMTGGYQNFPFYRQTWTAAPTGVCGIFYGSKTVDRLPVVPGQAYSGTIWVRSSKDRQMRAGMEDYNAAGTAVGGRVDGPMVFCPANVWTPLTVTRTIPATVARTLMTAYNDNSDGNWAIGDSLDATLATFVPGTQPVLGVYGEVRQTETVGLVLYDEFDGTGNATSADTGQTLSNSSGAWPLIGDGTVGSSGAGSNPILYGEMGSADQDVSTFATYDAGGFAGVVARYTDASNYIFADFGGGSGSFSARIGRRIGGTVSTSTVGTGLTTGPHSIRLIVIGDAWWVFIDGVQYGIGNGFDISGVPKGTGTKAGLIGGGTHLAVHSWLSATYPTPGISQFPRLFFKEDFEGTVGTALSSGVISDTGQSMQIGSSISLNGDGSVSTAVTGGPSAISYDTGVPSTSPIAAEADVNVTSGYVRLTLRGNSSLTASNYVSADLFSNSGFLRVRAGMNGSNSIAPATDYAVVGTTHTLRLEARGETAYVFLDGALVGSFDISSLSTRGQYASLWLRNNSTASDTKLYDLRAYTPAPALLVSPSTMSAGPTKTTSGAASMTSVSSASANPQVGYAAIRISRIRVLSNQPSAATIVSRSSLATQGRKTFPAAIDMVSPTIFNPDGVRVTAAIRIASIKVYSIQKTRIWKALINDWLDDPGTLMVSATRLIPGIATNRPGNATLISLSVMQGSGRITGAAGASAVSVTSLTAATSSAGFGSAAAMVSVTALTAAATRAQPTAVAMTSVTSFGAAPAGTLYNNAASMVSATALTAAAVRTQSAAATLNSVTQFGSNAPTPNRVASAALASVSTMAAVQSGANVSAAMTSVSAFGASITNRATPGAAALVSPTALTANGTRPIAQAAAMVSVTTLTATQAVNLAATAALTSPSSLAVAPIVGAAASATMTSVTALTTTPGRVFPMTATLVSVSALTASMTPGFAGRSTMISVSTLNPSANPLINTVAMGSYTRLVVSEERRTSVSASMASISALATAEIRGLAASVTMVSPTALAISATRAFPNSVAMLSSTALSISVTVGAAANSTMVSISQLLTVPSRAQAASATMVSPTAFSASGAGRFTPTSLTMVSVTQLSAAPAAIWSSLATMVAVTKLDAAAINRISAAAHMEALSLLLVAAEKAVPVSYEILMQRRLTDAFINTAPAYLVLKQRIKVKTDSGGVKWVNGVVRAEQKMRFLERTGQRGQPIPAQTPTGVERAKTFMLLGSWNATIGLYDVFSYRGTTWKVTGLYWYNGWERRADVEQVENVVLAGSGASY